jgi:hypothetical protein
MKKKHISSLILLPALMTAGSVILSRHFSADIIDNTKITQKHIHNGTVLVITSRDYRIAEKVKRIVSQDIRHPHPSGKRTNRSLELLGVKEINKSVIYLNNGIKLSLTSEIPKWINNSEKHK